MDCSTVHCTFMSFNYQKNFFQVHGWLLRCAVCFWGWSAETRLEWSVVLGELSICSWIAMVIKTRFLWVLQLNADLHLNLIRFNPCTFLKAWIYSLLLIPVVHKKTRPLIGDPRSFRHLFIYQKHGWCIQEMLQNYFLFHIIANYLTPFVIAWF